jgi:putative membrane protein
MAQEETRLVRGSVALAALVFLGLLWLLYGFKGLKVDFDVTGLPSLNAGLNAASATCLGLGYWSIRTGHRRRHAAFMVTAMGFSALFLASYLLYHAVHGDTPFAGQGTIRGLYFTILITHIIASAVALPLVFIVVLHAALRRFAVHRRYARYAFPVWMYVSVTGVMIYALLRSAGS